MSEHTDMETPTEPGGDQPRDVEEYIDGLLRMYAYLAEQDITMSLTLLVGGTEIGGVTCSRVEWAKRTGRMAAQGFSDPKDAADLERTISHHFHDDDGNVRKIDGPPTFIHLRDVVVGRQRLASDTPIRVRLEAVDAWWLGYYTVD